VGGGGGGGLICTILELLKRKRVRISCANV